MVFSGLSCFKILAVPPTPHKHKMGGVGGEGGGRRTKKEKMISCDYKTSTKKIWSTYNVCKFNVWYNQSF